MRPNSPRGKRVEAAVVEIVHLAGDRIEPIDADRRLDMFASIGRALRIGQIEAVDFDQHKPSAIDLLEHVVFERVVQREFLHDHAE